MARRLNSNTTLAGAVATGPQWERCAHSRCEGSYSSFLVFGGQYFDEGEVISLRAYDTQEA